MELNINERVNLLDILPQQGDFTTLKIVRELRESLSFNEEEHKKHNFRQKEGMIYWNNDTGETKDIPIGEKANDIIKDVLKNLNENKKLRNEHFTLYEKFVGG
jgi:hypothetical protein